MSSRGSAASFLAGVEIRSTIVPLEFPFSARGLAHGQNLDVVVAESDSPPSGADLSRAWMGYNRGRSIPAFIVVLHGSRASVCGRAGGALPAYQVLELEDAERLCRWALETSDPSVILEMLRGTSKGAISPSSFDPSTEGRRQRPFDPAALAQQGARRRSLLDWKGFLLGQAHVLQVRPDLFFQQAANEPDVAPRSGTDGSG